MQEVGCGYRDWIGLTQDGDRWRTLVSAIMNKGKVLSSLPVAYDGHKRET